ncbi:MAG: hypothetical protein LBI79_02420 [Nitrososphaerota archaeon]|nr:hypothetical protein [Nitrososphaerota archaeon]
MVLLIGTILLTVQGQSSTTDSSESSPTTTDETETTDEPTETPEPTETRTRYPTATPKNATYNNWFLIEIAAGAAVFCVAILSGFMLVRRRGPNEKKLRRLPSNEFNTWVLKRLAGRPSSAVDTSFGINGFTSLGYPLSIKQSDSVGMNTIDLFAASMARSKARSGIIVAFGFSDDALRGKVRARRGGLDIQMLTVQELLDNKRLSM